MIEFVFFSLCPRHSLSQKQPVQTREKISSSSSLFLDCKTTFSSKKKKKTPSFPSKKESITRAWKSKPYARIDRVNTVFAFRAFFHLFSCTRSGSGSKVYERFFFLFCVFFSRVFSLEKKFVPLLSFFSFFFFSFSSSFLFSLCSGEKKTRKNISRKKRAFSFDTTEREKNIRTTYAREVQKERKLSPILLLPSLFSSLLFVSRRGTCVIRLWQKRGDGIFSGRPDPRAAKERKKWGKVKKRGGADSAEKGEKRFKTLVSTQNYL